MIVKNKFSKSMQNFKKPKHFKQNLNQLTEEKTGNAEN